MKWHWSEKINSVKTFKYIHHLWVPENSRAFQDDYVNYFLNIIMHIFVIGQVNKILNSEIVHFPHVK